MFGATGQVAREVLRLDPSVVALGRDRADLSDPAACAAAIAASDCDLVLNAAAYTQVDKAESEPDLARLVNADSPIAMAQASSRRRIPFLHVSTDYVFDGSGHLPWRETDGTSPINTYGRTKLAGETGILASAAQAIVLRTSWVFSAHGNNFVKTMLRLGRDRPELNVVEDQIGGPTPAAEIARTLLHIARSRSGHGLYHYSGMPDTSWKGFAQEVFRQAGLKAVVKGIPTSAWPTPARRPLNSRLDCSRLWADFEIDRPDWRIGLGHVLAELETAS